jgi:hypothetical protein
MAGERHGMCESALRAPENRKKKHKDLLMHFWIYPSMFRQVIAIITGSWFPQKLLKHSVVDVYGSVVEGCNQVFYDDTTRMLCPSIKIVKIRFWPVFPDTKEICFV